MSLVKYFHLQVYFGILNTRARDKMNTVFETSEFKWKTLVENYEGFQNELDNASHGIDLLKELFIDFQKFEVKEFSVLDNTVSLRSSQILFLIPMSERRGSDIKRL